MTKSPLHFFSSANVEENSRVKFFLKSIHTYSKKKAATLIMYKGTLHGLIQSYYIYNNINIYIYKVAEKKHMYFRAI